MNHQARQFDTKKGTLQRPCKPVPACLARWPEKGHRVTTTDHPIIANDFYCFLNDNNKLTETDKRGTLSTYTYDKLNRVLNTTKDNLVINQLEYDEIGNIKFSTNANGRHYH